MHGKDLKQLASTETEYFQMFIIDSRSFNWGTKNPARWPG